MSLNFKNDIIFLATHVDTNKNSVTVDDVSKKITLEKKRSLISNFFHWVISLITCSRLPQNEKLDKVTLRVLRGTLSMDFCSMEGQERNLIKKAIINLSEIVKKNGGSKQNKIKELLKKIEDAETIRFPKIQELPCPKNELPEFTSNDETFSIANENFSSNAVQQVNIQLTSSKNEEPFSINSQTLQEFENEILNPNSTENIIESNPELDEFPNLTTPSIQVNQRFNGVSLTTLLNNFHRNASEDNAYEKLATQLQTILPTLSEVPDIKQIHLTNLVKGVSNLDKNWLQQNCHRISPDVIKFLVQINFEHHWSEFIPNLFDVLILEPIDETRLVAFLEGFPVFKLEFRGSYKDDREKIYKKCFPTKDPSKSFLKHFNWQRIIKRLIKENKFNTQNISTLERILPEDKLNEFIRNFFGLIAIQGDLKLFEKSLKILNQLNENNRKVAINALCCSLVTSQLAKLFFHCASTDNVLKIILEMNPPKDPDDFFKALIVDIFKKNNKERYLDFLQYVFENESEERQQLLFNVLNIRTKVLCMDYIPVSLLKQLNGDDLKSLVVGIKKISDHENQQKALQILAEILTDHPERTEIEEFLMNHVS